MAMLNNHIGISKSGQAFSKVSPEPPKLGALADMKWLSGTDVWYVIISNDR